MAAYSLEDIEALRNSSGISYQEAVALLDYHDGSVTRALVDLERKGKLRNQSVCDGKEDTSTMKENNKRPDFKDKALGILHKLYRNRIKIHKNDTPIVNVSLLFAGACLIFAPHLTVIGFIISIILGYRFSYSRMDPAFASDRLEKMVMNAAQNAKSSVSSVVQTFSAEMGGRPDKSESRPQKEENAGGKEKPAAAKEIPQIKTEPEKKSVEEPADDPLVSLKKQTSEIESTLDSFFSDSSDPGQFRSAYSASASSVPTIQVPVRKETRDGTVHVDDDHDGYASVTIG